MPETTGDIVGNYMLTLTRGEFGRETILVRGNLSQWMRDRKGRPSKDPGRWMVSGWRCMVMPVNESAITMTENVLGRSLS